jgi:hypothetical protein
MQSFYLCALLGIAPHLKIEFNLKKSTHYIALINHYNIKILTRYTKHNLQWYYIEKKSYNLSFYGCFVIFPVHSMNKKICTHTCILFLFREKYLPSRYMPLNSFG